MLGYFTEDESLDGQEKSNRGGSGGQTVHKGGGTLGRTRTIKLESAPLVLILHLKQFYFDSVHGPRKRGLRIKYEDELEVGGLLEISSWGLHAYNGLLYTNHFLGGCCDLCISLASDKMSLILTIFKVPAFFLSSKATTMCKGTALR